RHYGYVAACSRMPPETLVSSSNPQRAESVFMDGSWPSSESGLREGMVRFWKRKLQRVEDLGSAGPPVGVASIPDDDCEDRLLLGRGFCSFIECLAEGVTVRLGDPVKEVWQTESMVKITTKSGQSFAAPFAIVTVPSGVLAELHPESCIHFTPALPADKAAAIKRLSMPKRGATTHEKVVLRWPVSEPFVSEVLGARGAALQFETTDQRFHFLNLHKYGREGPKFMTAAFKRDPVGTDVEVTQPLVEEEDESRDLLMPLPTPTLLPSKSTPVAEGKVEKDNRSADDEDSVSSAAESRAGFTIEEVDVWPFLPKVLPTSTVLGALCMLWVQLPALHVYAPARVCFGTLFLGTMGCMAHGAYADPGQMQETVDVEQGMPQ
ncbi:PAO2, partial [Symbiodinium necroappetens]